MQNHLQTKQADWHWIKQVDTITHPYSNSGIKSRCVAESVIGAN